MRLLLLPVLLLVGVPGAAAPVPSVPIGHFQTWLPSSRAPMAFTSGGVTVEVVPLPCPAHPEGESSCRWDGYNNQARVTVRAGGVTPLSVTTDRQSGYARIAVVRFGRSDPRPGVIVESQSGGSGGNLGVQFLVPSRTRYRVLSPASTRDHPLQGAIADEPGDLSGDGYIDLKLEDGAFDSTFGCNACTPRPPRLFTVKQGRVVDESRDPALRSVFAADMARLGPLCVSEESDRNGACAAYVADAARGTVQGRLGEDAGTLRAGPRPLAAGRGAAFCEFPGVAPGVSDPRGLLPSPPLQGWGISAGATLMERPHPNPSPEGEGL